MLRDENGIKPAEEVMTILTKRVHDPSSHEDGTRILIVRKPGIANMKKCPYDELRKELSPSETLFGMYYITITNKLWGHGRRNEYI